MIVLFFGLQGLFAAGGIFGQNPSYCRSGSTEVRGPRRAVSAITRAPSLAASRARCSLTCGKHATRVLPFPQWRSHMVGNGKPELHVYAR